MATVKSAPVLSATDCLAEALRANSPEDRLRHAEAGLAAARRLRVVESFDQEELDQETMVLLLRQAYLAHLELRQLRMALTMAESMVHADILGDIAHHDHARILQALGQWDAAIDAQKAALDEAPKSRQSFHRWSLATLQHFGGQPRQALSTLADALEQATEDAPLIRAHAAYIRLDLGEMDEGLQEIRKTLRTARCGQGYGQFVLGMIAHLLGDRPAAATHLEAFLRRNARIDVAKELTLREELRRARVVLAGFVSS